MNSFALLPLFCLVSLSLACYFPPPTTTTPRPTTTMPPPTTTIPPPTTTIAPITTSTPLLTRASTADNTCTGREPFLLALDRIALSVPLVSNGAANGNVIFSAIGQQRAYCYKIVDSNAAADVSTFSTTSVIDPVNGATSITIAFVSATNKPINVVVTFFGRAF